MFQPEEGEKLVHSTWRAEKPRSPTRAVGHPSLQKRPSAAFLAQATGVQYWLFAFGHGRYECQEQTIQPTVETLTSTSFSAYSGVLTAFFP